MYDVDIPDTLTKKYKKSGQNRIYFSAQEIYFRAASRPLQKVPNET